MRRSSGRRATLQIFHLKVLMRSSTYHPRRGHGKIFTEFERKLQRSGLSWNIESHSQTQHVIWPEGQTPPLQHIRDRRIQLENRYGYTGGARTIPINVHLREIPEWTQSDLLVKEFLLHRFPNLHAKNAKLRRRTRVRARRWLYTIYLWYRVMLPAKTIAEITKTDATQVLNMVGKAKIHAEKFLDGEQCGCRKFGQLNQYGPTRRAHLRAAD